MTLPSSLPLVIALLTSLYNLHPMNWSIKFFILSSFDSLRHSTRPASYHLLYCFRRVTKCRCSWHSTQSTVTSLFIFDDMVEHCRYSLATQYMAGCHLFSTFFNLACFWLLSVIHLREETCNQLNVSVKLFYTVHLFPVACWSFDCISTIKCGTIAEDSAGRQKSLNASLDNWRAPWKNRTSRYISFCHPLLNGVLFPMFCF